jgi:hypothetical protein
MKTTNALAELPGPSRTIIVDIFIEGAGQCTFCAALQQSFVRGQDPVEIS